MFWDNISLLYDLFENVYNGKVYTGTGKKVAVKFITLHGADFKRQFDLDSYKKFFVGKGYSNVEYHVVDGRMPCAIAVITKDI